MANAQQVEAAILALEAQRENLGDAVVDVAIAPLRAQLAALRSGTERAAKEVRLRQITVLFTDIVGSTALGAKLDPEDTVAIVSTALARFGAIVERERGRVARFTGDGLKGIFGTEAGTEDAPENAVRAGLAILADARSYAAMLRETRGVDGFQVRVGVSTGMVALGGGVEADNSAVGMAVNLAARLEQAAPPGGLLISKDTFAHVRGLFEVSAQPPLLAKGHAAPLETYLVQGTRERAFRVANRGVAGVDVKMIGRDAELAALRAAFDEVAATHTLRGVTVIGEAGVGKSRLLDELQRVLQGDCNEVMLLARARPQLRLQPYGLLREMLAAWLQIADTESAETARRLWCEGLAPFVDPIEAEMLGHLVGLDFSARPHVAGSDARQLRDRAFRASHVWLRKLAAQTERPLVLLFDDLHWADEGSLHWLRQLLANLGDVRLFVVMLARPELLEANPQWAAGEPVHRRVDVGALDAEARTAFAAELLRKLDDVPDALVDILTRGSGGNPFFMEELVNMFVDDGVIVRAHGDTAWRVVPEKLRGARVPPTIAGVLQARIDALEPGERNAIQQASIIGPVFWDAALDALEPQASDSLPILSQRQMAGRKEASTFADCAEFAFSHHLLHQATYETVLKAARRIGHSRAAAWLSARVQDRSLEHLGATADHYERAGEREQAARFFARAAQAAADRYANEAALEHTRRALDNMDAADIDGRFEMLRLREAVLDLLGRRDAQRATLDEMVALCPAGSCPQKEAEVFFRRAMLADRSGSFSDAIKYAQEAIRLGEPEGMWSTTARAYGECAYVLTREGEFDAARAKATRALEHARLSGESLVEAQIIAVAGNIEQAAHRTLLAIELDEQALEIATRHAHTRLSGVLHSNLAHSLAEIGDFERARIHHEESLRVAREIGNRSVEANALGGLSNTLLALGDVEAALAAARAAVAISTQLGDRYYGSLWLLRLGDALFAAQRLDEAVDVFEKSEQMILSTGVAAGRVDAAVCLAEVALVRGDRTEALHRIAPVLAADAVTIEASSDAVQVEFVAYRVLASLGDSRAGGWLRAAHQRLLARAGTLPEGPARERLLAIPLHRAIRDAYQAVQ